MVQVARRDRIQISVYAEMGGRHHQAHCHVRWPDGSCSVDIQTLEILAGTNPPALGWMLLREHQAEIQRLWDELNIEGGR